MKIYSAPLQGFTEAPWRNAHEKYCGGIDAYFAPFIRLEKSAEDKLPVRNKDLRDKDPENNSVRCLVPQILASQKEEFRILTDIVVERGYRWIDINFGCPFPMISKRHKGCGILPYPKEVEEIMAEAEKYPEIEFSVKMRLGAEKNDEWREVLPILNETKLKMITIHPRTGKQQYKGDIDIDNFEAFMNECKHNLVYNGNILEVADISSIEEKYPSLSGIMIGRGLLGKPWLAADYKDRASHVEESVDKIVRMHDDIFNIYSNRLQGDSQILNKMKCFWEYIIPNIDKKRGKEIKKSITLEKYIQAVNNYRRG